MHLALERRAERSVKIAIASPLIAITFTLATMAILFALLRKNPLGVYVTAINWSKELGQ